MYKVRKLLSSNLDKLNMSSLDPLRNLNVDGEAANGEEAAL